MKFAFNEQAFLLMQEMKLPEKWWDTIRNNHAGKIVNREELDVRACQKTTFPCFS
jgi:hypothetical protein